MSWLDKLGGLFGHRGDTIVVHILIKGRVGDGWHDVDRKLRVPAGTTLKRLMELADAKGIPLRDAVDKCPHLRHTLVLNGEPCPLADNLEREMQDKDELYLLAPIAGG